MNVLVDTSIWSLAMRRGENENKAVSKELTELIRELRVQIIGPVRQELLSGIKTDQQYQELKKALSAFSDIPLTQVDFEKAAEFFNICRKNGIQGTNTDFLICSIAYHHNLEIFTSDNDFGDYKKYLPIKLYMSPRGAIVR